MPSENVDNVIYLKQLNPEDFGPIDEKVQSILDMLKSQAENHDEDCPAYNEVMLSYWNVLSMQNPHNIHIQDQLREFKTRVNRDRCKETLEMSQ